MPFSIQDILLGIVVPAATAFTLAAGAPRVRRLDTSALGGLASSLAVVAGFLLGYWLLKLGPVLPKLDRDWVPYSAVFALLPAAIPYRGPRTGALRLCVLAVVTVGAAWLLVPTWPTLTPSRSIHLWCWSIYTVALAAGLQWTADAKYAAQTPRNPETGGSSPQPERETPTVGKVPNENFLWLGVLVATLAAASGLLALSGSLRFAQTTGAAMAAYLGLALALLVFRFRCARDGVALVYAMLISAAMLTGKVNSFSSIPVASYAILPLTPLIYGLALPKSAQTCTASRMLLAVAAALVTCGLAVGLALAAEF